MKRPTGKTACRNSFYLNIYRKAWDTEHEILYRMLQEGRAASFLSADYGIPKADIVRLYKQFLSGIGLLAKKLRNLQRIKKRRMILRRTSHARIKEILRDRLESHLLDRKISDTAFVFTKRMHKILYMLELTTIREMTEYPLHTYLNFRGFNTLCMKELIAFIEFENLQRYFKGFKAAKNEYCQ